MAINGIVQYTVTFLLCDSRMDGKKTHTLFSGFLPDILLFTQAPILVWFDGTIVDISTILLTKYYSVYVLL